MTKQRFTIQPQRHNGTCWQMCQPWRATGYAIVAAANGKVMSRHQSMKGAKEQQARYERLAASPTVPQPTLGSAIRRPRSEQPIARSLTRAEYAKLKGLDA